MQEEDSAAPWRQLIVHSFALLYTLLLTITTNACRCARQIKQAACPLSAVGIMTNTSDASLYDRIGGEETIKNVVQRMFMKMYKDERILDLFSNKSLASLKIHNLLLLRGLFGTDGNLEWDAQEVFRHHHTAFEEKNLNEKDFDHFVTFFIDSLIDEGIAEEVAHEMFLLVVKLRPVFVHRNGVGANVMVSGTFQSQTLALSDDSSSAALTTDLGMRLSSHSELHDADENDIDVKGQWDQGSLLERIGGVAVLDPALHDFLPQLLADKACKPFFAHIKNPFRIAKHHFRFMVSALSETEDISDLKDFVRQTHRRFFRMGLNEAHFVRCHKYFLQAFRNQGVSDDLISEIDSSIYRFAATFAEGAEWAKTHRHENGIHNEEYENKTSHKGLVARLLRRARRFE